MPVAMRVSLPGYDALLETNKDRYALYTDDDDILIKEYLRGGVTFSSGQQTIAHNFGYIPFFLVYVNDTVSSATGWKLVGQQNNAFIVNNFLAFADTTNLYIQNTTGVSSAFKYYIFYDDQVGSAAQTFTKSDFAVAITRAGADAIEETDPNDFLFHSDLNTFKILGEGTSTISYTADGQYTVNHGVSLSNPTSFMAYIKFPDNYVGCLVGENRVVSRNEAWSAQDAIITTTQIKVSISRLSGAGAASLPLKYYVFETPL